MDKINSRDLPKTEVKQKGVKYIYILNNTIDIGKRYQHYMHYLLVIGFVLV